MCTQPAKTHHANDMQQRSNTSHDKRVHLGQLTSIQSFVVAPHHKHLKDAAENAENDAHNVVHERYHH
jgi:hypothetical protein